MPNSKRRSPRSTFSVALNYAEKRLPKAREELVIALAKVMHLNAEITSLGRTITALQLQVNPDAVGTVETAQDDGAGSILSLQEEPAPEVADIDSMPGMDGTFV